MMIIDMSPITSLPLSAVGDPEDPPHLHPGLAVGPPSALFLQPFLRGRCLVLLIVVVLLFLHILVLREEFFLLQVKLLLDGSCEVEEQWWEEKLGCLPCVADGSSPVMAALRRLRDPTPWMCLRVIPDLVVMGEGGQGEPAGWLFTALWESPHQSDNEQTSSQPNGKLCLTATPAGLMWRRHRLY